MVKTTTVTLAVKQNMMGEDVLVAPTKDGVFWLSGYNSGMSRATWREGESITVCYCPDDQFATEVESSNGKDKKAY